LTRSRARKRTSEAHFKQRAAALLGAPPNLDLPLVGLRLLRLGCLCLGRSLKAVGCEVWPCSRHGEVPFTGNRLAREGLERAENGRADPLEDVGGDISLCKCDDVDHPARRLFCRLIDVDDSVTGCRASVGE
jgi:hypothetical protein